MSRNIHLLVDETGRAHPPDLEKIARRCWRCAQDRPAFAKASAWQSNRCVYVSDRGTFGEKFGKGIARVRTWLPREKFARDGAARPFRRGRSRCLGGTFRCRSSRKALRAAGCGREGC